MRQQPFASPEKAIGKEVIDDQVRRQTETRLECVHGQ